jgi:protein phosphatase
MTVTFECAGKTDIGRVRKRNEDQFLIADLRKSLRVRHTSLTDTRLGRWTGRTTGHLLVVADGMGGQAGGEIASGLAVEAVSWYVSKMMPWFLRHQGGDEDNFEAELVRAVEASQRSIAEAAAGTGLGRMGTTLTLACVLWPRAYVVHLGDSRCYLHRDGRLWRITKDHTVAQRAVDDGLMSAEQAKALGWGHALWKCVGGGCGGVPDVYAVTLRPGDGLLLCTDGLTRDLTDESLADVLARAATPREAVDALVAAANAAGGADNVTAVVVRLPGVAEADTLPEITLAPPADVPAPAAVRQ